MKIIKYIFAISFLAVFFYACEIDNYDAPSAGIYGKIVDSETGQPYISRSPGGGKIRLLEQSSEYPTPTPIDVEIMENGQFRHEMLFTGTYQVYPWDGAFVYSGGNVTVNVDGVKEVNFSVLPYLRIAASVSNNKITYTITRPASVTSKVVEIAFMVNNYNIVDESVCTETSGGLVRLNVADVPDSEIIGVARTYTFSGISATNKYFRVAARVGSKWNYSPVVMQ